MFYLTKIVSQGIQRLCLRYIRLVQPQRWMSTAVLRSNILDAEKLQSILVNPEVSLLATQLIETLPQKAGQSADLDQLIVNPLLKNTPLSPASITYLLKMALALDLPDMLSHDVDLTYRLYLLSPDFVLGRLIGVLSRFGVTNPARTIRACPDLFTAAMLEVNDAETGKSSSRLVAALTTLRGCLSKKDLGTLIKNFPAVLTRSQEELKEMFVYLSDRMGFEPTSELILAALHPHQMRHSTRLYISTCPAWKLPLAQVISRHTLLVLANRWPPNLSQSEKKSKEFIVGKLLICAPEHFSYWLEYSDEKAEKNNGTMKSKWATPFSVADVRIFDKMCSDLHFTETSQPGKKRLAFVYENEDDDGEKESEEDDNDNANKYSVSDY